MLYSFLRFLSLIAFKILFRFKAEGLENIPEKGGFILASNHVSYLDPIAIGIACKRKLNYMAKDELFRNPLAARFFRAIKVFPVKRDSADLSAIKEAMRRVMSGGALVLFPEGSRRFDTGSSEPYAGIGFLTVRLNVPVIPAFVRGTGKALPAGAKIIRPVNVSVCFGKQISIERRMPYQDIARHIMDSIRHLSC
ncbi:MAG: 1-acyl-sn-glycerol-3-phosphate acyltransferase [Candidatus Omnitrophica bacterium]|nr:1-acyl-sn-glycerol-3-phosphate acyltransferase [Candidatus Omnitrophota bacterium]